MFKKFIIALIITISAFNTLKADAVVLSEDALRADISRAAAAQYGKITDGEIQCTVLMLPFSQLTLPDGKIRVKVETKDNFRPRDVFRVTVYSNSNSVKTFNVPIQTRLYKNVFVASSVIPCDKIINYTNVKIERKEIANLYGFVIDDKSMPKELYSKKVYKIGEILDNRFVKLRPQVMKNSEVTVFFSTNNLTITIGATALSEGNVGDSICVMNKQYNRLYRGTIIGENRILVQL